MDTNTNNQSVVTTEQVFKTIFTLVTTALGFLFNRLLMLGIGFVLGSILFLSYGSPKKEIKEKVSDLKESTWGSPKFSVVIDQKNR
jgi:uncharacterized membrane protein YgaE (UPF0421/DUF939 family)